MSKAEELAKKLGKEIERTVAHDVLMHDALTHLRALEANRQMLVQALERNLSWLTSYPGGGTMGANGPYEQSRTALEQAKELA